jgi:hypothetical protein
MDISSVGIHPTNLTKLWKIQKMSSDKSVHVVGKSSTSFRRWVINSLWWIFHLRGNKQGVPSHERHPSHIPYIVRLEIEIVSLWWTSQLPYIVRVGKKVFFFFRWTSRLPHKVRPNKMFNTKFLLCGFRSIGTLQNVYSFQLVLYYFFILFLIIICFIYLTLNITYNNSYILYFIRV